MPAYPLCDFQRMNKSAERMKRIRRNLAQYKMIVAYLAPQYITIYYERVIGSSRFWTGI